MEIKKVWGDGKFLLVIIDKEGYISEFATRKLFSQLKSGIMPWIIKVEDFSSYQRQIGGSESITYKFSQKRNFSGTEGESVLFLVKKLKWIFIYSGEILELERLEAPEGEERDFFLRIGNLRPVPPPNQLEDYSYSLARIRNFEAPIDNFSRKLSRISGQEYEAITNGQIFVSRTVFGKVVNALHRDHRLAFSLQLIRSRPEVYFQTHNYLEAFQELKDYVNENIFQHIDWLVKSHDMLKEMLGQEELNQIGFQLPDAEGTLGKSDKIVDQVRSINDNKERLDQEFWTEMETEMKEASESEEGFNELFYNQPLPIQVL